MLVQSVTSFDQWREEARKCLRSGLPPAEVAWTDGSDGQQLLALGDDCNLAPSHARDVGKLPPASPRVPKAFIELARNVACHRNPRRWNLLYQVAWRIAQGEHHLLEHITDDDVHQLQTWRKQVRRDAHKMKAFVRFRSTDVEGTEWLVAWYRPDHRILRLVAPFFVDRFSCMNWSVLCPDESMMWDQQRLHFGPGTSRQVAPQGDELEAMWLTYFRSTFNPARVKWKAMCREMPQRFWPTLPEAKIIEDMVAEAPRRVADMVHNQPEAGRKESQKRQAGL